MNHRVKLTILNHQVEADPDPVKVMPRNYVTWYFSEERPDVQVEFFAVRKLDQDKSVGDLLPTGPNGPFVSLAHSGAQIVGMVANFETSPTPPPYYRFYYHVLEDGDPLNETDLNAPKEKDLVPVGNPYEGGVDVPVPPPPMLPK